MGARVRPPSHLGLTALSLLLSAPALALTAPPDCGIAIATGQVVSVIATGLLLVPGYFPGDREIRPGLGLGASWYSNSSSGGPNRDVTVDLGWSASVRRRVGDSRFNYRAWSMNFVDASQCHETHHARSRLLAAFGVELLRGGAFQVELGVGPHLALLIRAQDADAFENSSLGFSPFLRVAYDSPEDSVGVEAVAWYMLEAGRRTLHRAQVDLTFFMRFQPFTLAATVRGEVGAAYHPVFAGPAVPSASGSLLLGLRL